MSSDFMLAVSETLKYYRESEKLSIENLAEKCDMSVERLKRLEGLDCDSMTLTELDRFSDAVGGIRISCIFQEAEHMLVKATKLEREIPVMNLIKRIKQNKG